MINKKIFLNITLIMVIMLACTGCLLKNNQNTSNSFFFKDNISEIKYIGTYQSAYINNISATLSIKKVATVKHGVIYNLTYTNLQYGKIRESDDVFDEQALLDEMELGHFYVESNKIYSFYNIDVNSRNNTINNLNNEIIPEDFILVCSDEGYSDKIPGDKDGTHAYVKTDGDKREYHGFDVYNGDGKGYINFTWEKGKGLIYYRIGYGALRDEVILTPQN